MEHGSPFVLALLLLFLLSGSFAFSAIQTSLFSLPRFRLDRLLRRYPHFEKLMHSWLERPRQLLGAILLADYLVNLPLILICLALLWQIPSPQNVSLWLVALLIFSIIFILCDLLPKLFALNNPLRVAAFFLPLLKWVLPILEPMSRVLERFSEHIAEWLTPRNVIPQESLSGDEMETLVNMITEEGRLREEEGQIIRGILKLKERTVRDYMVPRVDMVSLSDDLSKEEVLSLARLTGFRRFPVYHETPDKIIGILNVQDYLAGEDKPFLEALIVPRMIPETMDALDLLVEFLHGADPLMIIVDEYGGTEGLITWIDIVEDLIGDVMSGPGHGTGIELLQNGRLLVRGDTRLDDLSEVLGIELETDGLGTIGGLVFTHLGYMPKAGAILEIAPLKITVRRIYRKRIAELLIYIPPEAELTNQDTAEVTS